MAYQTFAEKYKYLISLMDTEIDINFRKGLAISTEDTRAATKVAHSNHQNKAEFFESLCPEYCPMQQ